MHSCHSSKATAGLLQSLDLEDIARTTLLIKRASTKFSATGFLMTLLQAVCQGSGSLSRMVMDLAKFQPRSMSKQGLSQRFSAASSEFLAKVRDRLLEVTAPLQMSSLLHSTAIHRVLMEDSTVIKMHPDNASHFRANGNQNGPGSGCKVNLLLDILGQGVVDILHRQASNPDQSLAGRILDFVRQGDLVLRDRGYFNLGILRSIEDRKAFWISCLPASVSAFDLKQTAIEDVLVSSGADQLEMEVEVGVTQRLRCRLIAFRLPPNIASRNRRQKRKKSTDNGKTPTKKSLLHAEWHILLTNLEADEMDAQQVRSLYDWRWQIEIQFRALKREVELDKLFWRKSNRYQLEAYVHAIMLFGLLSLIYARNIQGKTMNPGKISYEKVAMWLNQSIRLVRNHRQIATLFDQPPPDPRHVAQEVRRRKSLTSTVLSALHLR